MVRNSIELLSSFLHKRKVNYIIKRKRISRVYNLKEFCEIYQQILTLRPYLHSNQNKWLKIYEITEEIRFWQIIWGIIITKKAFFFKKVLIFQRYILNFDIWICFKIIIFWGLRSRWGQRWTGSQQLINKIECSSIVFCLRCIFLTFSILRVTKFMEKKFLLNCLL